MANYLASSAAAELGSLVHLDNGSDASSEDDDFLLEDIDATTEEGRQLLLDRLLALRTEGVDGRQVFSVSFFWSLGKLDIMPSMMQATGRTK
eukprot:CAMPEP_0114229000 /NCGR_PEP_ID=MMETSP0058-20121206/2661_1 /TAXON_ID=36894 /ORGANISM="Pyramimonas parkeae, CCMP726" /LENGTH=91 /DNA_ID=CAMNT_0001340021 /DNA_START=103 /DNA_END=378 /DNA_ORIENTATION=+